MRGVTSGATLAKYAAALGVTVDELRGKTSPDVSRATMSKVGQLLVAAARVDVAWRAFQDLLRDYAADRADVPVRPEIQADEPGTPLPRDQRQRGA